MPHNPSLLLQVLLWTRNLKAMWKTHMDLYIRYLILGGEESVFQSKFFHRILRNISTPTCVDNKKYYLGWQGGVPNLILTKMCDQDQVELL